MEATETHGRTPVAAQRAAEGNPVMKDSGGDWFIINTKPKQEFAADKQLRTLAAVDVYLPVYRKKVKKGGLRCEVIAPLFTGYIFARFDIDTGYQMVRYTRGVKSILGQNQFLWTIGNDKIEDIRSRETDGVVVLKKKEEAFLRGDRIQIDEGDFEGWEGIFQEELPDRERAIILLTNVHFSSKLILPKKYLSRGR